MPHPTDARVAEPRPVPGTRRPTPRTAPAPHGTGPRGTGPGPRPEQSRAGRRCAVDQMCEAPYRRPARPAEVTAVPRVLHAVLLHSRPHIDLQRVAGALCRS